MKLVPKTHKGKNKIREAGTDEWEIVGTSENTICLGGRPGFLIQPKRTDVLGVIRTTDKRRWILQENDPDFEIIS